MFSKNQMQVKPMMNIIIGTPYPKPYNLNRPNSESKQETKDLYKQYPSKSIQQNDDNNEYNNNPDERRHNH
jgi:hypothetical protein